MNSQELKNYLADSPPTTVNLVIRKHFEALDNQQKRYAHYISRYESLYRPASQWELANVSICAIHSMQTDDGKDLPLQALVSLYVKCHLNRKISLIS